MRLKIPKKGKRGVRLRLSSGVSPWHLLFVVFNGAKPKVRSKRNGKVYGSIIIGASLDDVAAEATGLIKDALCRAFMETEQPGWRCHVVGLQPYGRSIQPYEVLTLDARFETLAGLRCPVFPPRDHFVPLLPAAITGRKPAGRVISIAELKRGVKPA